MLQSTSGKLRKLYLRQEGRCKVCQAKITSETFKNTYHVVNEYFSGSNNLENFQLLHPNCHKQLHSNDRFSIQPQQTSNLSVVSFA
ncbi:HNH endonuclease [Flexithrix dorotheae]|uniref:HNH endonuclease signature motif containing protein n=1 Tax=Flexithrix dorotheae TaxID=70993 RepID=UPI00036416DD